MRSLCPSYRVSTRRSARKCCEVSFRSAKW